MLTGEKAIAFIEQLKHSKDKWAGTKFKLEQWQKDFIYALLEIDPLTTLRTHSRAMMFVPRKNGKSFLVSALALAFLVLDGQGLDVVCAAASREQASYVFDEAAKMVRANRYLSSILKIRDSRKTIYYPEKNSVLRAVSADANLKLGGNFSHIIADEIQIWPTADLWDALTTSQAARTEPLAIAIGTAGVYRPESIGYKLYELAKKVKEDPAFDPTFVSCIYEAPKDSDYTSEDTWRLANPNYGVSVQPKYFQDWMAQIKGMPSRLGAFLCWHLNIWVQSESRWLAPEHWAACSGDDYISIEELRGRECYCGLDLAATSDLCAFCMVFPLDDGRFAVLVEYWCPGDNAKDREHRDHVPYLTWSRQGHIHLTKGNTVDYAAIRKRIGELSQLYSIKEIAVDMLYQGASEAQRLQADGFDVVGFGQGWRSMSPPILEIEKLVMSGRLIHFNNPVLKWNANNCVITHVDGNPKLSKEKSRDKIDGMVAMAMGLGRALNATNNSVLLKGLLMI